jgi:hypothetical protein
MLRRIGIVVLACALSFGGEAPAKSSHRGQSSPVYWCYWEGTRYDPGGYCVSNRGVVEVCLTSGDWMSVGRCLGDECRVVCPG